MNHEKAIQRQRQRRRFRVRKSTRGTPTRPRLSICRSHQNISCQIIDDVARKTLVSAGTADKEVRGEIGYGGNKDAAQVIGRTIAQRALAAGIQQVAFDRGHYKYHGRVAALADAAREAGLSF